MYHTTTAAGGGILSRFSLLLAAIGLMTFAAPRGAEANVYATNIRMTGSIPGSSSNATVYVPCELAEIHYLLNDTADAGVTLEFLADSTVVRTMNIPAGSPGTFRGTNTVIWDVRNDLNDFVPLGFYHVRVTAKSHGYGDWTRISDDYNPGNYVYQPRGIAVNRNTNSPYYGRVFVSNSQIGFNPDLEPGDRLGILKLNADGSPTDADYFADGGWSWAKTGNSPGKIEIAGDDQVYINDDGILLRFDQSISGDSRTLVLRDDNFPGDGSAKFNGPFISSDGANKMVWMADLNSPGSVGIHAWMAAAEGTLGTNDTGMNVVLAGTNSDLNLAPYDVALDSSNRIYTIQFTEVPGDPIPRVLRFPVYEGTPLTNADWQIGGGNDNLSGASGIAVDAKGNHVAVAFAGMGTGFGRIGGGVRVFRTQDGSEVRTLTQEPYHDHTDVAWDNVGNLYVCDNWNWVWRVYSPPGPNQATTVSLQTLEAGEPPVAALLRVVAYDNNDQQFHFTLRGRTNIFYVIEGSTDLRTWVPVLTNRDDCATRLITVASPQSWRFYRALAP